MISIMDVNWVMREFGGSGQDQWTLTTQLQPGLPSFSGTATYANQNQQSGIDSREDRLHDRSQSGIPFHGNRAVYLHF